MSNFVNGTGIPVVLIKSYPYNEPVETIRLDLCGEQGLTESYEEEFNRVQLSETGEYIDYNFRGSRIIFRLDYSEVIFKANSFNIEKIFHYNSLPEEYNIYLFPRIEAGNRYFKVRLLDGIYSQGVLKGGGLAGGNKGTVISFITTTPVSKNFVDIDSLISPTPLNVYSR